LLEYWIDAGRWMLAAAAEPTISINEHQASNDKKQPINPSIHKPINPIIPFGL
jgi:hypothetical protein